MHESSKLGYISTSNGYKWAIKHKHLIIYLWLTSCTSVNIQVLMKDTFKTSSQNVNCKNQNKTHMIIM